MCLGLSKQQLLVLNAEPLGEQKKTHLNKIKIKHWLENDALSNGYNHNKTLRQNT